MTKYEMIATWGLLSVALCIISTTVIILAMVWGDQFIAKVAVSVAVVSFVSVVAALFATEVYDRNN